MKKLFLISVTCLLIINIVGQVIPEERRVDWESAILNINFYQPDIQVNVMDFGAIGDGITNDQPAVMNAISSLAGQAGYVYFPPGNYLIEEPIILPDSCILVGSGSDSSTLVFDMGENAVNCISISKTQTYDFVTITGGYYKDHNLITVADVSSFSAGDYVEIRQQNGAWDVVPISWADYSVGQITRVIAVIDNKLLLESALRIDYSPELNPEIRPIIPISNAGIKCIKIKRVDESVEGAGANIYTNFAANCMIRGVESDSSVGSHVSINSNINILIDGCYFHHAFTYDGVGTRGYGVTLNHHTSECLITNNVFRYLRHAMMVKTGANGNVFSYNYSIEPYRTEQIHDASGDISFHGHYAYSNLMEGNIAQNIVTDHYWGPSGPHNTMFRNRAELYGIIMTTSELLETNDQNYVGNEVTNTEFLHGLYVLTGEDQFEYGNNVKGEIIPAGTNYLSDSSYYLSEPPYFWNDTLGWPSVGIPNQIDAGTIPAKLRYEAGGIITVCPDSLITAVDYRIMCNSNYFETWPNPAKNFINVKLPERHRGQIKVKLTSTIGNTVLLTDIELNNSQSFIIITDRVKPGIYLLTIIASNKIMSKKVIIAK
ncbi:MAG: T9SS type A sorting domain-containing protein [Bacteroidetes bacterium]|nr:T9SS type A sorting domain-containing protein [Bacteroidota bacterium]MBL6944568.1 T9SS type A sorting domain-containing protein [Bacteroidales bacterium]